MQKVANLEDKKVKAIPMLAWIICALAACFYMYAFLLEVSPGIITSELMRDLKTNSIGIGTLAAFYYYSKMPMQIPAGILFDWFGPRRVLPCAIGICAIGAFLFAHADSVYMASLARFFIGFGSAFLFIGPLLLISRWFPFSYFPVLSGLLQLLGFAGAILGQGPLATFIAHNGWRLSIIDISYLGFILVVLCWLCIRDYPAQAKTSATRTIKPHPFKRLLMVVRSQQNWLVGLYGFTSWAPIQIFASLWGVPFIQQTYQISTPMAAFACSLIWVGCCVGCPLAGVLSNYMQCRRRPLILIGGISLLTILTILYVPHIPLSVMYVILFIFGLSAGGQSLSFAVVTDNNQSNQVGTAFGFNNMITMIGGALFQPIIGWLLHLGWNGNIINKIPIYSTHNYQMALFILPICSFIAIVLSAVFIRETFCKPTYTLH